MRLRRGKREKRVKEREKRVREREEGEREKRVRERRGKRETNKKNSLMITLADALLDKP